jgi:hypothetical protein
MKTTNNETVTAGHGSARASFTPGPWFVENIMYGGPRIVYGDAEAPEGFRSDVPWREASEQAQANARLIAAAPELLAALRQLADACEMPWMQTRMQGASCGNDVALAMQTANAAIAKAEATT